MKTSTLAALAACLCLPLTACAGTVASQDGAPAPSAPSSSSAPPSTHTADWSCTEAGASLPMWSHPAALASDQVLAVHLVEEYTHLGVGELTVHACDASDDACATPLASATTNDAGVATLVLPPGAATFDGYIEVIGYEMPTNLIFFDGRAASDTGFYDLEITTRAALAISQQLAGATLDPQRGLVRIEAHDCAGAAAPGVALAVSTADRATTFAYSTGDGTGYSPDGKTTDSTGVAVAFGVKDGGFGVHEAVGQRGVGGALAFARAGAVSSVVALP